MRTAKPKLKECGYKQIPVHPEMHKKLSHEAIEEGWDLYQRLNVHLAYTLGMEHLIPQILGSDHATVTAR